MKSLELITTGTEIVTGDVLNSNASWLARACADLGIVVARHTTVGDDHAAIGAACREAIGRAEVVIVTGGLGPTSDDFTLAAFAAAIGRPLIFDAALWDRIQAAFARRGKECTPNNRRMAELPEGAVALRSAVGLGLGVCVTCDVTTFFFLPGVPQEVERIFPETIAPWLREHGWGTARTVRVLRCFGLPEATIGQRIEALQLRDVEIGYRVVFPETFVKIIAHGTDPQQVQRDLDTAESAVRGTLGDVVYGAGDDTLAGVVGRALSAQQATLAIAESCTGGCVSDHLTNVAGASRYFERAVVSYSNAAKQALLGVPAALLAQHGAVSADVAAAMARGVRESAGTTYGLAVTGIAGPTGGTPEKPVGTVHLALATPRTIIRQHCVYPHERVAFKTYVTCTALDLLRRELQKEQA